VRTINLGFEGENLAGAGLARTLWLQGHADQAAELARRVVKEAARYEHPVIVSISLMWTMTVFHWPGDLAPAEEVTQRFVEHADCYSLGPHRASELGMQGMLALSQGKVEEAVERLQSCFGRPQGYTVRVSCYIISPFAFSGSCDNQPIRRGNGIDR
jgi:hypothetical protein